MEKKASRIYTYVSKLLRKEREIRAKTNSSRHKAYAQAQRQAAHLRRRQPIATAVEIHGRHWGRLLVRYSGKKHVQGEQITCYNINTAAHTLRDKTNMPIRGALLPLIA